MTRIPILMYHSVTPAPTPRTRSLSVSPGAFAAQMTLLHQDGFTPLTLSGLWAAWRDGTLPDKPVVITFDDGYADFHENALPVLDRLDMTATLFVTSGWVRDAGAEAAGQPLDRTLSWNQLREAADQGIEIGGHSHSHPQLDQLTDPDLHDEMRRSKGLLEDHLARSVTALAYPFGYSSGRVRRAAGRAGFHPACAVGNRLTSRHDDELALPRLTVFRTTSLSTFRRCTHGRSVPLTYLVPRVLTSGYAVVRRSRYAARKVLKS